MTPQESPRHHFVPEFLMKPLAVDGKLNGYWWDHHRGHLSCRRKGSKAFCYEIDRLSVERLPFIFHFVEHEKQVFLAAWT